MTLVHSFRIDHQTDLFTRRRTIGAPVFPQTTSPADNVPGTQPNESVQRIGLLRAGDVILH